MAIRACGHRLVLNVDKVEKEEVSSGGIIIVDDKKLKRAAVERGVVVSVGPTCWKNLYNEDSTPWCKEGDYVTFARYAGRSVEDPTDGETYVVINDEDVVSLIETKEEREARNGTNC